MRSPQGDVIATYNRKYDRYEVDFDNDTYRLENDELPVILQSGGGPNFTDPDDDLVLGYEPGTIPAQPFNPSPIKLEPATSGGDLAEVIELKELHLYGNRRLGIKVKTKLYI